MITVPVDVLDAAGLDAEMRAIAEMAASGSEQRAALPPVEMDPAERAMEEQPQIETSDIWIEELPDVPAPGGGGASTSLPQPFEPTFAADATTGESLISAIGPGYAPWGRRLLQVDWPASSSSVWTTARGRLGLKITHPTTYGGTPTVEIVVAASSSSGNTASLPDSTDAISYLPLYDFDNGRITLDLRCYLALGVYE